MHQLYGNAANWREYARDMAHYLPYVVRGVLLKKERESGLRVLRRRELTTAKQAKQALVDCLHAVFMKMKVEVKQGEHFFFGAEATSLDAVLCAALTLLDCAQLPVKYLDEVRGDAKVKCLLRYSRRVVSKYHASMMATLAPENDIAPIPILSRPKTFARARQKGGRESVLAKWVDTEEKRNSAIFVAGSVAAFALYWMSVHGR